MIDVHDRGGRRGKEIKMTYLIHSDLSITASQGEVPAGAETFTTQKQLTGLATSWPMERVVAIWNHIPGVKPVKKFVVTARPASHESGTPSRTSSLQASRQPTRLTSRWRQFRAPTRQILFETRNRPNVLSNAP